ncbi:biotin--[acetyl-CoA-carboxylase] ligase [Paenibacillus sediminis]|uniref:Bifunctional ligase/repressor BirA n=1 Tax=Paenibacillus sediminis TaxID=664909 RepID=A0ABS4GZU2_9BACL|nr:biotin--[acetyl-CoA-carboxylase] ligase [Paenibacillus sediminis]MBP1935798.1 BirA family biotin operon repressor/biotin-[acetyl-CoA-carboxylase] ligase [Paenibacillus sediminis]
MNEQSLLDLLLSRDDYISGEELSKRLSISRTAVWKQINKLREQGYQFEAVSRRGYKLTYKPDRLHESLLLKALANVPLVKHVKLFGSIHSTQIEAQRLAEQGAPEGTLVIAEEQTAGKGRLGRKWHSPAGKGIWMSFVLRPLIALPYAPQLTLMMAVAVCRAIRSLTKLDVGIKWPNDLLINGRKISGILIESATEDERIRYCIVGIGIDANLDEEDYPEELRSVATSLKVESGQPIDRAELIGAVMKETESLYELYQQEGFAPIASLWEALSITLHQPVRIQAATDLIEGTAIGLHPSGALIVEDANGVRHTIFSADVQLSRC